METSGDLLTSWQEGRYQHILKIFYSITVRTENCSATKTIAVSYKKEFDSSFTSLGTMSSNTSNTLYFTDYITTKKLQLKFTFSSDSNTVSPYVTGYSLRCISRPFDRSRGRLTINEHGEFSVFGGNETS